VLADVPDPGTGVRLRDALHDVTHLVFAAKIFCHQCKWALRTARNAMMPSSATRTHIAIHIAVSVRGRRAWPGKRSRRRAVRATARRRARPGRLDHPGLNRCRRPR
jgi:hypothetical protein